MLRKKKSKKKDEARDVSIRELMERGQYYGPTPNGHDVSEDDEELADHEFTEELRYRLDEETEEIQEEGRAFNVAGNGEARPATEDEAADKVNAIWRQRLEKDGPQGSAQRPSSHGPGAGLRPRLCGAHVRGASYEAHVPHHQSRRSANASFLFKMGASI